MSVMPAWGRPKEQGGAPSAAREAQGAQSGWDQAIDRGRDQEWGGVQEKDHQEWGQPKGPQSRRGQAQD